MAVSPGGRWLYATSELALAPRASSEGQQGRLYATSELALPTAGLPQHGTLTVIDLRRAETHPASRSLPRWTLAASRSA